MEALFAISTPGRLKIAGLRCSSGFGLPGASSPAPPAGLTALAPSTATWPLGSRPSACAVLATRKSGGPSGSVTKSISSRQAEHILGMLPDRRPRPATQETSVLMNARFAAIPAAQFFCNGGARNLVDRAPPWIEALQSGHCAPPPWNRGGSLTHARRRPSVDAPQPCTSRRTAHRPARAVHQPCPVVRDNIKRFLGGTAAANEVETRPRATRRRRLPPLRIPPRSSHRSLTTPSPARTTDPAQTLNTKTRRPSNRGVQHPLITALHRRTLPAAVNILRPPTAVPARPVGRFARNTRPANTAFPPMTKPAHPASADMPSTAPYDQSLRCRGPAPAHDADRCPSKFQTTKYRPMRQACQPTNSRLPIAATSRPISARRGLDVLKPRPRPISSLCS